MTILNQPFQGQLGDILISKLLSDYQEFTIFSAFAKNSGVLRMKKSMELFRQKGGIINAFIGIDLGGTSYEALLNLYHLCDNLYVIHSENFNATYHSKIYLLKNTESAWYSIGSNNFTGGGLWTNFESCLIKNFSLTANSQELKSLQELIDKYSDDRYICSAYISSVHDIDELLHCHYITTETTQRLEANSRQTNTLKKRKRGKLFGSEKVSIPPLLSLHQQTRESRQKVNTVDYTIFSENAPAFTNEQFWFEMRESTGGSRNILDLSKLGKIESGSVAGTIYEVPDPTQMLGGIRFFGLDPDDTDTAKNITINYLGKDYYPSTIKFTPGNGSWRIQLKGSPVDGSEELSKFGNRGDYIHKLLIFEKITNDYFALSLLDESELEYVKSASRVWARNGSNSLSRAYGML
jgi:HKD family nuclease